MIQNLEEKLSGQEPITREELCKLISSWGRSKSMLKENGIFISDCIRKKGYSLENLDVSKIINFTELFSYSYYNGDLSKWNISNAQDMFGMFYKSEFNNDSLNYWNLSSVTNIEYIFYQSKFNGNISSWDISNIKNIKNAFDNCPFDGDISSWNFNKNVYCYEIFCDNENFKNKYNYGYDIPNNIKEFLIWFEENREKIKELNQNSKEEILDFFDFNKNLNKGLI